MKAVSKVLSLILACVLAVSTAIPAFAAGKYHHSYDSAVDENTPVIYIPGIFNMDLVNSEKSLFFPEMKGEEIFAIVKKLLKLEDTGDYEGFVTDLIAQADKWCDGIECDDSGNPVDKSVHLKSFVTTPGVGKEGMAQKIAEQIGYDKVWVFNYDWRQDVVDIVHNSLRPFVESVLKQSGAKKVTLFFMSMGGALGNVYLQDYGNLGDTKTIVLDSGAQGGVSLISDIFGGAKLHIDRQSLVQFVESAQDGVVDGVSPLSEAVSAISDYVVTKLNKCMDEHFDELFGLFMRLGGYAPGVLELGNGPLMQKWLKKQFDPVKNKELLAKINNYYDNYQANAGKNVKTANSEKYCNVRLLAHYNCKRVPVTDNVNTIQTDFLIDTKFESCGATVLDLYKTFPEGYKVKSGDNQAYLSLDNMVDASTCSDPDHTWFVKNVVHCCQGDIGTQLNKFGIWLAIAEDGTTVNTDKNYPQWQIGYGKFKLMTLKDYIFTPDETAAEENNYISSAVTTYTYTQLTALGWALIALIALAVILIIVKSNSHKPDIDGVLTNKEIKALPKGERKAAKKNNKALKKLYKKDMKAAKKARKAELKAMPKAERKAAEKADKKSLKDSKKAAKLQRKADKAEKKALKKSRKKKSDSQDNAPAK